jgi:hypothetical protein
VLLGSLSSLRAGRLANATVAFRFSGDLRARSGVAENAELGVAERRIMQGEPNLAHDPFLCNCPQSGHVFVGTQPTFRNGGTEFGRWGAWASKRIPGGTLDKFGDTGVWGGSSRYYEGGLGAWRTTDHTFGLPSGLSEGRAISEFGGVSHENDAFWIYTKKPVTTFYIYPYARVVRGKIAPGGTGFRF